MKMMIGILYLIGISFFAQAENTTLKLDNLKDWRALSQDQRHGILHETINHPNIVIKQYDSLTKIRSVKIKDYAKALLLAAEGEQPDQDGGEFDEYVRVGSPDTSFQIFTLKNKDIIGGTVQYFQIGTESSRYGGQYFENEEELRTRRIRPPSLTDVSWVWNFYADEKNQSYTDDLYWEWTGF